jgi:putative redox protein
MGGWSPQRPSDARMLLMTLQKTVTASLGMAEGSLATDIRVRHHVFAVDEAPPAYDSVDAHPDPYDYILAGVAACTLISIRLSAEAKGYPLERADVEVAFRRQPPECEGGQADQITRTITLHGDLSDQEHLKLIRAADCAAYRSIVNGIPIITESRR